jgi:hypothetical protein
VLQVLTAGEFRNQATVRAERGLEDTKETTTTFTVFEGAAGAHLSVVDEEGNKVEVGGSTRYSIRAQNQGIGSLTNVRLTVTVPEQLDVIDTTPLARREGQKLIFEPFELQAGRDANYIVRVKAKKSGEARLQVEMTADQLGKTPVKREESTTIFDSDSAPPPPAKQGEPGKGEIGEK